MKIIQRFVLFVILLGAIPSLYASSWWSDFFGSQNQKEASERAHQIGKDVQQKGGWTLSNYWHTFMNTQNPTIKAHKVSFAFQKNKEEKNTLLKISKNQEINSASKVYSLGYLLTVAGLGAAVIAGFNGDMKTLQGGVGSMVLGIGLGAYSSSMINAEMNKNKKNTEE